MRSVSQTTSGVFVADLGFSFEPDGHGVTGELAVTDEILVPGTRLVHASVLATVADVIASVHISDLVAPQVVLTSDLAVHGIVETERDTLLTGARAIKLGASLIVAEAWFLEEPGGRAVAFAHLTFVRVEPPPSLRRPRLARPFSRGNLRAPFPDHLGARVLAPGVVELDRTPQVIQSVGAVQGGAVALLAELGATSLASGPVTTIAVRYLSMVRVGPARTQSSEVGHGTIRVEIRDVGDGNRLAAVALVRVKPPTE
jgi:acyl-coenzyme A thioesterase PaaI-like protein